MNSVEDQRDKARQIRYVTKKLQTAGTTQVIVVQDDGQIREITDKRAIETAIMEENEKKFHQTEGFCPLLEAQLLLDIRYFGDGPQVDKILDGTYIPPPGTDDGTVNYLKAMKRPDNYVSPKKKTTTLKDYWTGWKHCQEKTASGEMHFGHFKAGFQITSKFRFRSNSPSIRSG